jgi:uncharacterized membrane protein
MRAGVLRRITAIGIICLFILSTLIISLSSSTGLDDGVDNFGSRQGEENLKEIRVFFHRNNEMDTLPNSSAVPFYSFLNDGDEIDFALTPGLFESLYVKGRDVGSGKLGFRIILPINNPATNNDAEITIKILDGTSLIAKKEAITISGGSSEQLHEIPFIQAGRTDYTFINKVIHVNINASITTGFAPVRLTYENGFNEGYLLMECNPVSKITVAAYNRDGTIADEFYPNMPKATQRSIWFRGSITYKFGSYSIQNVVISMSGVFDENGTSYIGSKGSDTGYFDLNYTYSKGLTAKDYPFTADAEDHSRNHYLKSNQLTMAKYGAYLECLEPNGEGLPNDIVDFEIDVYNVGGDSDIIELMAVPDIAGWVADYQGSAKTGTLLAGDIETKYLDITVSATAAKNEKCIVEVWGEPSNNKKFYLRPTINVVAKAIADFEFSPLGDLSKNVSSSGGSVEYEFTLENLGQDKDSYSITADNPGESSGWSVKLSSTHSSTVTVSDSEITLELDKYDNANIKFTVTASADPEDRKVSLKVKATGNNASRTISRTTTTTIEGKAGIVRITAAQQTQEADPGNSIDMNDTMDVAFSLQAINEDQVEMFTVNMELIGIPSEWEYTISPEDFDLDPETTRTVTINIEVPESTNANPLTGYSLTARANYGSKLASINLVVTIPEVHEVELQADETEMEVEAGSEASFEVVIINKGNIEDANVDVIINELDGWNVEISRNSITLGEFNSQVKITVSITPTTSVAEEELGIFDVKLEVDGEEISSNPLSLKVTVKKDVGKALMDFLYEFGFIAIFVVVIIFGLTFFIRKRLK